MRINTFLVSIVSLFLAVLFSATALAYSIPFYRDQTNVQYSYPGYYGNEWSSGYGYGYAAYGYYRPYYSYSYNYYPSYSSYYYSYPAYYSNYYSTAYVPYTYTPYYVSYVPNYPYNYKPTVGTLYYSPQYNDGKTFYLVG